MPMAQFLDGLDEFDPETRRVMGVAFEMTCAALRFAGRSERIREIAPEIVAAKIIALAKAGECDPDQLCERALSDLCCKTH